jgi:hypothetical protein
MPDPIRVDPQEAAAAAVVPFGASADEVSAVRPYVLLNTVRAH